MLELTVEKTVKGEVIWSEGFKTGGDVMIFGGGAQCDGYVHLEGRVSSPHAFVQRDADGRFFVRDLGSETGTRVSGEVINAHRLSDGDVIRIGDYSITLKNPESGVERDESADDWCIPKEESKGDKEDKYERAALGRAGTGSEPPESPRTTASLGLFCEAARLLNMNIDFSELVNETLELIFEAFKPSRGFIGLVSESHIYRYHLRGQAGTSRPENVSNTIIDQVLRERETLWTPNAAMDKILKNRKSIVVHKIRSVICAPAKLKDNVVAIVYIDSGKGDLCYTREDAEMLDTFCTQLAINIEGYRKLRDLWQGQQPAAERPEEELPNWGRQLVGNSAAVEKIRDMILQYAEDDHRHIFLSGERGTGKTLVARLIHKRSKRRKQPIVCVNAAAIPPSLAAAAYFGRVRGAFTDAYTDTTGYFERANCSTLFIDEVGLMPREVQGMMLNAIEDRKITKVGDTDEIDVDVRLITATNLDLEKAVREGTFDASLLDRIRELEMEVPPLRERTEDIPLLIAHFVDELCDGSPIDLAHPALKPPEDCTWEANIRGLRTFVIRALNEIRYGRLGKLPGGGDLARLRTLKEVERQHILYVLENTNTKSDAADVLDVARGTLDKKIRDYGISPDEWKRKEKAEH